MQKKLSELSYEELERVYDCNRKIQEMSYSHLYDAAMDDCMEIVSCWPNGAVDYEIGYSRSAYFAYRDEKKFIDGLRKAQERYSFLSDNSLLKIDKCTQMIQTYEAAEDDVDYDGLLKRIGKLAKELASDCHDEFIKRFEISSEECKQEFCEFGADKMAENGNFYVGDGYKLYENCVICYA